MSLQFTDNRRSCVGRELDLAIEIEPVDGLQESDRADLNEIFDQLASVSESTRKEFDQSDVLIDESLAVRKPLFFVRGALVGREQRAHLIPRQRCAIAHGTGAPLVLINLNVGCPSGCCNEAESATVARIICENSVRSVRTR